MDIDDSNTKARPFVRRRDLWFFLCILIMAAVLWFWLSARGGAGSFAHVFVEGEEVLVLDMSRDTQLFLEQRPAVEITVKDGKAAITASDCPDAVCIQRGFLQRSGQSAVCAPNRVSLRITSPGGEEPPDAIAG